MPHKVTHQNISEEELPTLFSKEQRKLKSTFTFPREIQMEMEEFGAETPNNYLGDQSESSTKISKLEKALNIDDSISGDSRDGLEQYRNDFLRELAPRIFDSHETLRKYYNRWTVYCCLGVIMYTSVGICIYLLVCHSSIFTLNI